MTPQDFSNDPDRNHDDSIPRFDCETAGEFLPRYLDGELPEHQAAPLREHLLACVGCRTTLVDQRNVTRWFQAPEVAVPEGFAARVARRAFAGDPGAASEVHRSPVDGQSAADTLIPAARQELAGEPGGDSAGVAQLADAGRPFGSAGSSDELLPFVLRMTMAAAVVLFVASIYLGAFTQDRSWEVDADALGPRPWQVEEDTPVRTAPVPATPAARPDVPAETPEGRDEAAARRTNR